MSTLFLATALCALGVWVWWRERRLADELAVLHYRLCLLERHTNLGVGWAGDVVETRAAVSIAGGMHDFGLSLFEGAEDVDDDDDDHDDEVSWPAIVASLYPPSQLNPQTVIGVLAAYQRAYARNLNDSSDS